MLLYFAGFICNLYILHMRMSHEKHAHVIKEKFERVDLHVALDEIKWGDGHVSEAAAENSAGCARGVVLGREHRYLSLVRGRDHEA